MKNTIPISIFICLLLANTTLSAQNERVLKYVPNAAQVVLSFAPSELPALLNEEEWAAQTWLEDLAKPLQLAIMGKRKVRELIGTLTHYPATVGIDTTAHWHFVSERDSLGISKYTLFMPMQNIGSWLDFVQKSLPLYTNSDLKLSISTIFYLQRDNFIIAWNREHIRISCFVLPNQHQYTPTYVEYKKYMEQNILPRLVPLPDFNLLTDSAYLRQLSAPNQSFCLRLKYRQEQAILAFSQSKNETLLHYQQNKIQPIFTAAYLANLRHLQFDLRQIATFAPFLPARPAYTALVQKIAQLPTLDIKTISPSQYTFKIPFSIRDFLLLSRK
jgi:hypothetical protein